MPYSILIPITDSVTSRAVLDYVAGMAFRPEDVQVTLLHLYKKPSASEDLMGKKFIEEQPARFESLLERAKEKLVTIGFDPKNISVKLIKDPYPTITEGIIDQFRKEHFDMVVIGRKRMSKAEEFVMGDISVKLVRALEKTAVLVVKSD